MTPFESRTGPGNSQDNISHITVREVLSFYWPLLTDEIIITQGSHGLSGAILFKISKGNKLFCLKGHLEETNPDPLALAHKILILIQNHDSFLLPKPELAANENSLVKLKGRIWELLQWIPGEPLLEEKKSLYHVMSVVENLRKLHEFFAKVLPVKKKPIPGWAARIKAITFLENYFISEKTIPNQFILSEFHHEIHELIGWGLGEIKRMQNQPAPVGPTQLCWGDARPDNVHFFENKFSGFTDFSSMRVDSVETDLARFLGEFCLNHPDWFLGGLDRYGLTTVEQVTRVLQLDALGIMASLSNWLRSILSNPQNLKNPNVMPRLEYLKNRLIKWKERGTF